MGVIEGKTAGRALGNRGRASFTLYVLLGPSIAVGIALAGFSLTRGADSAAPAPPAEATASPAVNPLAGPGEAGNSPLPAGSNSPTKTVDPRTSAQTARPTAVPTTAPTAPVVTTNPPTAAPTPAPTATSVVPTLSPLPSLPLPTPTLPLKLPKLP